MKRAVVKVIKEGYDGRRQRAQPDDMQTNPVIEREARQFAEAAVPKLTAITNFFSASPNPVALAEFLEQIIITLVQQRLGQKRLLDGVIHAVGAGSETSLSLCHGIVHDPAKGNVRVHAGHLVVAEPHICAGLVQVTAFAANLAKIGNRLGATRAVLRHCPSSAIMAVVVRDPSPEKKSWIRKKGVEFYAYDHMRPKWCPVFILFTYRNGAYEPYYPAIKAFLANLAQNFTAA